MKLINKTPHEINIFVCDDYENPECKLSFEPVGEPIRLSSEINKVGILKINNYKIPLTKTKFGETKNLPKAEKGTYYIVSSLVAQANPHRSDLLIVNESVRDEKGRIIGAKSLSINPFLK